MTEYQNTKQDEESFDQSFHIDRNNLDDESYLSAIEKYVNIMENRVVNEVMYPKKNGICQSVIGSALLDQLLNEQEEIISNPRRFNGVSVASIKKVFAKNGVEWQSPF